jgi:hypothetical protein
MPRRAVSRSCFLVGLLALGVALLSPAVGRAQGDVKSLGGPQDLKGLWPGKHKEQFLKLIKGEEAPEAGDDRVLDSAATYFVYRTTWPDLQTDRKSPRPPLTENAKELAAQIKDNALPNAGKNQEFMKKWTKRMIAAFEEVFAFQVPENRLSVVNACLLLPVYAQTRHPDFGEFLEKLITDDKLHDVIKLYALKALREYLPAEPMKAADDPADKTLQARIARDKRRIESVMKFLDRKWEGMDPAVALYLRREAVRTLAESQVPALVAQKGKVVAPVAPLLVQALAPEKDDPNLRLSLKATRLSVRGEAAIGVCRMHGKWVDDYQPEVGLYLLGRFLVDFINEYRGDYANFGGKKLRKEDPAIVPLLPWKLEADRLLKALDELPTNLRDESPSYAKAVAMAKEAKEFLTKMKTHGPVAPPNALNGLVRSLAPTAENMLLFRGVKESKVDLPAGD